jgi:uncharacterized protein YutE (UPF0331/DUF86 family)
VGEVNRDRLRELAGHVRDSVRQLREKYLLIVAAEAALDNCNHLAARRGGRSPEDYADCMAIMAELGVIDADLSARLMRMARFRNLLVHLYARVNDREVHRVMREDLGDLERYLEAVGRHLKAEI